MMMKAINAKKAPITGQKITRARYPSHLHSQLSVQESAKKSITGMKRNMRISTIPTPNSRGTAQYKIVKGTIMITIMKILRTNKNKPTYIHLLLGISEGIINFCYFINFRISDYFRQTSRLRQGSLKYSSPHLQQNYMPHLQFMYSQPAIFYTQIEHFGHLRQLRLRIQDYSQALDAHGPVWATSRQRRQCSVPQMLHAPFSVVFKQYPLQSFLRQAEASLLPWRYRKSRQLSIRLMVTASSCLQIGLFLFKSAWHPSCRHLAFAKFSACDLMYPMQHSAQKV